MSHAIFETYLKDYLLLLWNTNLNEYPVFFTWKTYTGQNWKLNRKGMTKALLTKIPLGGSFLSKNKIT